MIAVSDENGRTYESKYGTYNKKDGFDLSILSRLKTREELINDLLHEDCWSLKKEPKKMTKEEIEKALGYEIEIDESKEKNKSKDNQINKLHRNVFADDIFDFLF